MTWKERKIGSSYSEGSSYRESTVYILVQVLHNCRMWIWSTSWNCMIKGLTCIYSGRGGGRGGMQCDWRRMRTGGFTDWNKTSVFTGLAAEEVFFSCLLKHTHRTKFIFVPLGLTLFYFTHFTHSYFLESTLCNAFAHKKMADFFFKEQRTSFSTKLNTNLIQVNWQV